MRSRLPRDRLGRPGNEEGDNGSGIVGRIELLHRKYIHADPSRASWCVFAPRSTLVELRLYFDENIMMGGTGSGEGQPGGVPTGPSGPSATKASTAPEIVVLLTDGANTRGVSPKDAAAQAAARGIRVYPIGFGTTTPTQMVCTRTQLGGLVEGSGRGGFSGGGGGRGGLDGRRYLRVDEDALRTVATTTGGEYFKATDAEQLNTVLADLPKHVTVEQQDIEISAGFAALATGLLLAGLWLSLRWSTFPQ